MKACYIGIKLLHEMNINFSKYKFKRLLTKEPSETSSLEYIILTNYTLSFFYNI